MNTITKYVVLLILCLIGNVLTAQETNTETDSISTEGITSKLKALKELKTFIQEEEREYLKTEVKLINKRLEANEITQEKAEQLKKEAAKKRALNIENRIAIIDNRIELLKRNEVYYDDVEDGKVQLGINLGDLAGLGITKNRKPKKYDKRTTSDFVWAMGFNNAIGEGQKIGDEYGFMQSGFIELGWAWKTRVLKESNAIRLKYGLSFQWNKLTPKNNRYFVQNGNITTFEPFPVELDETEFRITNLVVPIHFEFGPSRKIERKAYYRYSTTRNFKVGIGGYAGFNIGTQQKLRFDDNGDKVKQKIRRNYNASPFVYGLSAYIGYGTLGIYAKYDLNPLFKDQSFDQHNLSIGFRFDLD